MSLRPITWGGVYPNPSRSNPTPRADHERAYRGARLLGIVWPAPFIGGWWAAPAIVGVPTRHLEDKAAAKAYVESATA